MKTVCLPTSLTMMQYQNSAILFPPHINPSHVIVRNVGVFATLPRTVAPQPAVHCVPRLVIAVQNALHNHTVPIHSGSHNVFLMQLPCLQVRIQGQILNWSAKKHADEVFSRSLFQGCPSLCPLPSSQDVSASPPVFLLLTPYHSTSTPSLPVKLYCHSKDRYSNHYHFPVTYPFFSLYCCTRHSKRSTPSPASIFLCCSYICLISS